MYYLLDTSTPGFPEPWFGDDEECILLGGDLSVQRLVNAYSMGYFPWYDFRGKSEIEWHCPKYRCVIFPDEVHVSHSMKQLLGQKKYRVTFNNDFDAVIRNCSVAQGRINEQGAWLGPDIIKAYGNLHRKGLATSVEVWCDEKLVGGLYGVTLGHNFFGESMFSLMPSASKFALITLARKIQEQGDGIIDCQMPTRHLISMGAILIPYEEYMIHIWNNMNDKFSW